MFGLGSAEGETEHLARHIIRYEPLPHWCFRQLFDDTFHPIVGDRLVVQDGSGPWLPILGCLNLV
jgi:hypothetical protein